MCVEPLDVPEIVVPGFFSAALPARYLSSAVTGPVVYEIDL
jgi:hypothetical protein